MSVPSAQRPPVQRRGYALATTLAVLAVTAVLLAHLARQSAETALLSLRLEQDLQRKWLVRSVEDAVAANIGPVLAPPDSSPQSRPSSPAGLPPARSPGHPVTCDLTAGRLALHLTISDEQAKLNVNSLWARRPANEAAADLDQLLSRGGIAHRLTPRPLTAFEQQLHGLEGEWPAFASFDQLAPGASADVLFGRPSNLRAQGIAEYLTLWGEGAVHYQRSGDAVFQAALSPELALAEIRRLQDLRREQPQISLAGLLRAADLPKRSAGIAAKRLTDQSSMYSVHCQVEDDARAWHTLLVFSTDPGTSPSQVPLAEGSFTRVIQWRRQ